MAEAVAGFGGCRCWKQAGRPDVRTYRLEQATRWRSCAKPRWRRVSIQATAAVYGGARRRAWTAYQAACRREQLYRRRIVVCGSVSKRYLLRHRKDDPPSLLIGVFSPPRTPLCLLRGYFCLFLYTAHFAMPTTYSSPLLPCLLAFLRSMGT